MNAKKLGAMLLTISMAATFAAAPASTSNAAVYDDYYILSEDIIDTYTKEVATYTGTSYLDVCNQLKTAGILVDGTQYDYDLDAYDYDNSITVYFKYKADGYSLDYEGYDSSTKKYSYTLKYTEYKDNVTGNVSTSRSALTNGTSEYPIPKKASVQKGNYSDITIYLAEGNTQIKKLKSSKKKVVKAKIGSKDVHTTTDNYSIYTDNGNYYYDPYEVFSSSEEVDRVYVANDEVKVNKSYAEINLRVYRNLLQIFLSYFHIL